MFDLALRALVLLLGILLSDFALLFFELHELFGVDMQRHLLAIPQIVVGSAKCIRLRCPK
jgi:hypothetical protein